MPAYNALTKAASGLSLARRTLGGVHGGHAVGFPWQAVFDAQASRFDFGAGTGIVDVERQKCPGPQFTLRRCQMSGRIKRSAMLVAATIVVTGIAVYSVTSVGGNEAEASPVAVSSVQNGGGVCYHTFVSEYVCPDSAGRFFAQEDIAGLMLTVVDRGGRRRTIELPREVDAILLTRGSAEKFLLSYYWAVNRDRALQLSRQIGAIR